MKKFIEFLIIIIDSFAFFPILKRKWHPLISDRAYAIANKIGWDKLYEKSKEAQMNGTCTIKLEEDE